MTRRTGAKPKPSPETAWLSRRLGEALDERTIVVNEYDLGLTQTCFSTPGSYFACARTAGDPGG